jgi:protein subunit release factor A
MICKLQKVFIKEELSKIDKKRLDQVKKAERSESKRIYNYQRDIVYDNITNKSATLKDIMKKAKIELLA